MYKIEIKPNKEQIIKLLVLVGLYNFYTYSGEIDINLVLEEFITRNNENVYKKKQTKEVKN